MAAAPPSTMAKLAAWSLFIAPLARPARRYNVAQRSELRSG